MAGTPSDSAGLSGELLSRWLAQARDHAMVMLDPDGTIVAWSGAAEFMLGHSPEEAVGQDGALIFTAEDRERGYPGFELQIAARDSYSEDSRWHVRRDGTLIWVSGAVSAIRDDKGGLLGFVKIMRDMTDQRAHTERAENELTSLDDARKRTRNFLRTLGHELRNPLSVLTNVHHILHRVVEDERGRRALQQLESQMAVLGRLADDLMDVSRLELGKVSLQLQPVDLRAVLRDAVTGVKQAAAARSIKLQDLLPDAPLVVKADPARLHQVVHNLLNNALKYTPAGGSIWVKASDEGGDAVCRVQDTGIGIFPPMLPRIFELFTQAHEGEEMRGGGIGVGLALVRQIVELHGGTVQAKSPGLGKGAEFTFRLPLLPRES
jgi:PAS domain S-box-containing protein